MTKKILIALLFGMLLVIFSPCDANDLNKTKPSVLICNWERSHGNLDLDYLRHLTEKEFIVDFMESRKEFTWDRISKFNAIVLYDFPTDDKDKYRPAKRPPNGPRFQETLTLLERYLDAGGGVFILISEPIVYYDNANYYFAAQKALKRWGAQLPMEDVIVPPIFQRRHPRMGNKLWYYTENIQPSPVSEGVKRIFYPDPKMVNQSWFASGPIDVDDTWQVVVRGPKGSKTRTRAPKSESEKANWPKWQHALRYEKPVEEPPLIAIRDIQTNTHGRLALMWCWERCHIGQGTKWNWNGVMLDKGLDDLSSDFDKLFQNTMRWLATPSMKSGKLGGAKADSNRLIPQSKQPEWKERIERYPISTLPSGRWQRKGTVFKGIIGPRTSFSGGRGTVADYAEKAKKAGLDFVIFLEDIKELDQAEMKKLVEECVKNSDDELMLFPGWRAVTNLGNQIFFAGYGLRYPPSHLLAGKDGKTYMLQGVNAKGEPVPSNSSLAFQLEYGKESTVGFFDFTQPQEKGGLSIPYLRCFSMCGVRYYDHGKEIENVTDDYLLTNEGSMSGTPVSVNVVDSPEEMTKEVKEGHALTYAVAKKLKDIWKEALLWNHPFISPHVFPSDGPIIQVWPGSMRTKTYGQDDFVVEFNHMPTRLYVTAANGLKEISLYDGSRLIARYLPGGAREFDKTIHLNATFQQNISVVAVDEKDKKAVSAPARTWKSGMGELYCADHVNGGKMWLARGKCWQKWGDVPTPAKEGHTWDGGPPSIMPLLPLGYTFPGVIGKTSRQDFNLTQIPLHIFCDERTSRSRSMATKAVPQSLRHGNCWTAYGPMIEPELYDASSTYTILTQYPAEVNEKNADLCDGGGNTTNLFEDDFRFLKSETIKRISLTGRWRDPIPSHVTLLVGERDHLLTAREIQPRRYKGKREYKLDAGSWFAGVSREPGNAMLVINHGEPIKLVITPDRMELNAALPPKGLNVEKGDHFRASIETIIWPVEQPLEDSDQLMAYVRYLQQPTDLNITRGKRLDKSFGIIELDVDRGTVDVSLGKPNLPYDFNLPVRLNGLNRNWTSLLWQKEGYAGPYHGSGKNRVRPLGVDETGRSYIPVTVGKTKNVHFIAGHPVIADNQKLVIRVVCLEDTTQGKQFRWHVAIHNPTDQDISATIIPAMKLPGLFTDEKKVTVPAGNDITMNDHNASK